MAMLPNYYYLVPKVKWTDGAAVVTLEDHSDADVVEVVRCRECLFRGNRWTGCPKLRGLETPDDFFCKYGQHREERKDIFMKEIAVSCTLYFDLLGEKEPADNALERIQEFLNDNDIAAQFYGYEIRDVE